MALAGRALAAPPDGETSEPDATLDDELARSALDAGALDEDTLARRTLAAPNDDEAAEPDATLDDELARSALDAGGALDEDALARRGLTAPNDDEAAEPDATLDDELARSALDAGGALYDDAFTVMSGLVDVTTYQDAEVRHQRPSPFGRLDLVVAWRRTDRRTDAPASFLAMPGEPTRRDELWLVAIWRN